MPFKTFVNGNTLTSAEVMSFMMNQQMMVFADATARDAAISNPIEGMFVFLKSNNRVYFFNGSSWRVF